MRQIKFRVVEKENIIGIERLTKEGWEWMCYELNPDVGERWCKGVYPTKNHIREQFTGLKDIKGVELYDGDIIRSFFSDGSTCLHTIVWYDDLARWIAEYRPKPDPITTYPPGGPISQDWINDHKKEVIGNIHTPKTLNN